MVQTLRPRSCEHSIDCGYATPEALRSIRMLLSQGTYVAGALG